LVRPHHYHAILASPRDELRPFGAGQSKHFAETGFGCQELPFSTSVRKDLGVGRIGSAASLLDGFRHGSSYE
jgi:hypothetical protein